MDNAERHQRHEQWLQRSRGSLSISLLPDRATRHDKSLWIGKRLLMLLTLEPHLFEYIRQLLTINVPVEDTYCLYLETGPWVMPDEGDCLTPPDDEALLATATQLAHLVNTIDSVKGISLAYTSAAMTYAVLMACSQMKDVTLDNCPLEANHFQAIFAMPALWRLSMKNVELSTGDLINAFCHEMMETSALQHLFLQDVSFWPEQEAHVAKTMARSKSLTCLSYKCDAHTPVFYHEYCAELSTNVETKLEFLRLWHETTVLYLEEGVEGYAQDLPPAMETKIRNLLKWNTQRKTCPPLFAAIGHADTDVDRKECLVKAFGAVDIPIVFEYITANENELIELIQRLGRSQKRLRED